LIVAGVVLAGCGLRDPYSEQKTTAARGRVVQAPVPASTLATTTGAEALLARYATTWVNWSATTLVRQRAALLSLATGALADELRQDAAQAVKTQLQEVSRAYSRGSYVGVIRETAGRAIVVTYEEVATLGGAAQGAYHVYLVRTERTAQGWRVSEWQPATDS
jgi:hypothetical protein